MAEFYLLGNTSPTQMFGCVIKTESKIVIIDGGTYKDSNQLVDFLKSKSASHVDAWFFTHPHHDHIGCFVDVTKKSQSISVDTVYYHFPNLSDCLYSAFARSDFEASLWGDVRDWDMKHNTHKLESGEVFTFDDIKISVLRVFNPDIIKNCINNSSTVYRIEGAKKSVLILGDLGVEGGVETMQKCPLELLKADYTQMAHHGQGGVSREFYEYIQPKRCIWASPEWLWNNDRGDGFDTSKYQTVRTREWMEALGVNEHIVEKDGIQKIEI